ncbi:hypothetical protein BCR34DRAFT_480130 [Clohesyomyces aquaticus]|uniref:Uncharacterized protein n=1 Tax=Clohesyomyces aquaticus TaxID=1231657 RepID=A0A1Y1ZUW2_9PLEO|nr:hypothetical protein BCR34DRAFT_480130 [Clohesyomyces aquaticus]
MQTATTPLIQTLHTCATLPVRNEIMCHLWRQSSSTPSLSSNLDWDAYFAYYTKQCKAALINEGKYLSARTHLDLLRIAHLLEDEPTQDDVKRKIREDLTQQRPPEEEDKMLDRSIRLAARMLAMINIGPLPTEVSGRHSLSWNQGSFRDALHDHFNDPQETKPDGAVIGTDLTARSVNRIFEVVLTDNLVDHLRLVEKEKKLCLFHHISFLKSMKSINRYVLPVCRLLLPRSTRK